MARLPESVVAAKAIIEAWKLAKIGDKGPYWRVLKASQKAIESEIRYLEANHIDCSL